MRLVLLTNGLRYGGVERIVEAIAGDLHERGHGVRVVATTRDGEIGEALRARGVAVEILGIRSAYDARAVVKLARIVRSHRAEIVHSHLAVADLANVAAHAFASDATLVSTVHSAYVGLNRVVRRAWRASLFGFHRVIAVSEGVRALLPPSLSPLVVRPSSIELGAHQIDRRTARARLRIDDDTPLVMSVGRLVPVKGFDVLARAARLVRAEHARLLVIGDGEERHALAQEPKLELLGSRGDAGDVLAAADVVVCASRSEGFPQAPLHAMAAGVPVVATRVGGSTEVVVDNETGLLVPSEDADALAAAIDRVLGDRALARRLGEGGRKRLVEEGLTRSAMLARMRSIYESLV